MRRLVPILIACLFSGSPHPDCQPRTHACEWADLRPVPVIVTEITQCGFKAKIDERFSVGIEEYFCTDKFGMLKRESHGPNTICYTVLPRSDLKKGMHGIATVCGFCKFCYKIDLD